MEQLRQNLSPSEAYQYKPGLQMDKIVFADCGLHSQNTTYTVGANQGKQPKRATSTTAPPIQNCLLYIISLVHTQSHELGLALFTMVGS